MALAPVALAISNHATAALVAPIAMNVALDQGMDPHPLLMAVAVGTTTALFTPFAHPSLILVMGPGGYSFGDYWRLGLPLQIAVRGGHNPHRHRAAALAPHRLHLPLLQHAQQLGL